MILLLDEVDHLGPVDVHREDGEEEEGLEIEVGEEAHHGQETEVLDRAVQDAEEEAECEHLDVKPDLRTCAYQAPDLP